MHRSLGRSFTDALRRGMAIVSAGLVLILTVLAASPSAHHLLHDGKPDVAAEDACAVILFATGVAQPVGPLAVAPPTAIAHSAATFRTNEIFLITPRFLQQPERGPPLDWVS